MLAHDVVEVAREAGHEVTALGSAQLDVTDAAAVREWVTDSESETVLNCAAWTDVDGAEAHEAEAHAVNADGAGNVAAAAAEAGASVVYVSTDYVFDGTKADGYVEDDEPAPLSAYGRTKLAGERKTEEANSRCFVVRSSWLFGAHGRNFVDTMLQLGRQRSELKVVDDQVGCPTFARHLAGALVKLAEGEAYGIHHLAGAGVCSWFEFAGEIFRRAEVDVRLVPCTTEEFPRPAPRPAYSVLGSERAEAIRLPDWREGLAAYLAERAPAR